MNERNFRRCIGQAWEFIDAANLGETFSCPVSLPTNSKFREKSLNKKVSYEEVFLFGLRNVCYNLLLADRSYLQFSRQNEESFRFVYYPNPFLGTEVVEIESLSDTDGYDDFDMEEHLQLISERRNTQRPPIVRYEYAPAQYVELEHPSSHFHLGHHSDNRWPIRRILTPEVFTLIILKQFYRAKFNAAPLLQRGPERLSLGEIHKRAKSKLTLVDARWFSTQDGREFFWG